jgi:hypothetical protein
MAHFCEINQERDPTGFTDDTLWVVKRTVVVSNDIQTSNGPLGENDMHVDGETWCQNFFKGGTWKQTSYNGNFRKQYAGKNFIYDSANDRFIKPQPFANWTLDNNGDWQGPIPYPSVTTYGDGVNYSIYWDETNQKWKARDWEETPNVFEWDPTSSIWISTAE